MSTGEIAVAHVFVTWLIIAVCFAAGVLVGNGMTPEEKVALLKEAGVWGVLGFPNCIDKLIDLVAKHERNRHAWTQEHWTEYEHAIAAAEREACAKVCDDMGNTEANMNKTWRNGCSDAAAAIRARGEK